MSTNKMKRPFKGESESPNDTVVQFLNQQSVGLRITVVIFVPRNSFKDKKNVEKINKKVKNVKNVT